MVNAADLKSAAAKVACGFKPRPRHWELLRNSDADTGRGAVLSNRARTIRVLGASKAALGECFGRAWSSFPNGGARPYNAPCVPGEPSQVTAARLWLFLVGLAVVLGP